MKRYFIPFVALFASLAFSLSPVSAAEPVRGGTLVIGVPENPDRLDGHTMRSFSTSWVTTGTLYNGLVTADANSNIIPDLAQSWEIKEKGKVWDFKLRQGVTFHDGSEFNAEVVKWNFERALDPKSVYADKKDIVAMVERIEVVDKYTIRFHLKNATQNFHSAPLAGGTGGRSLPMVSKVAVEKLGPKEFDNHPVGTGPFKVVEWVRDSHVTMVRNENYFKKGLPYFDRIQVRILADPTTRFSALRAGEVHIMYDCPPEMVPTIQKAQGVTYVRSKPCSFVWLVMNCHPEADKVGCGFFRDPRVRQAISLAIDRQELVNLVMPGMGEPATGGPLPFGNRYYHQVEGVRYDPERAKQLLKEAGYSNLKFTLSTNNSKARFARALEVMKEQLSRIGVSTEVEVLDKAGSTHRMYAKPPQFHAFVEDYEYAIDPSSYLARYLASGVYQNYGNWSSPAFDKLLEEGLVEGDFQKRKKIYDQAQEILVKEGPMLYLWYGVEDMAYSSKLKGYIFAPYFSSLTFEKAYLEK